MFWKQLAGCDFWREHAIVSLKAVIHCTGQFRPGLQSKSYGKSEVTSTLIQIHLKTLFLRAFYAILMKQDVERWQENIGWREGSGFSKGLRDGNRTSVALSTVALYQPTNHEAIGAKLSKSFLSRLKCRKMQQIILLNA